MTHLSSFQNRRPIAETCQRLKSTFSTAVIFALERPADEIATLIRGFVVLVGYRRATHDTDYTARVYLGLKAKGFTALWNKPEHFPAEPCAPVHRRAIG